MLVEGHGRGLPFRGLAEPVVGRCFRLDQTALAGVVAGVVILPGGAR
jgi:hypothetical protein